MNGDITSLITGLISGLTLLVTADIAGHCSYTITARYNEVSTAVTHLDNQPTSQNLA